MDSDIEQLWSLALAPPWRAFVRVEDPPIHWVRIEPGRISCVPECPTRLPHVSEFRAPDVNPNR